MLKPVMKLTLGSVTLGLLFATGWVTGGTYKLEQYEALVREANLQTEQTLAEEAAAAEDLTLYAQNLATETEPTPAMARLLVEPANANTSESVTTQSGSLVESTFLVELNDAFATRYEALYEEMFMLKDLSIQKTNETYLLTYQETGLRFQVSTKLDSTPYLSMQLWVKEKEGASNVQATRFMKIMTDLMNPANQASTPLQSELLITLEAARQGEESLTLSLPYSERMGDHEYSLYHTVDGGFTFLINYVPLAESSSD